jgi:hypothetical protein
MEYGQQTPEGVLIPLCLTLDVLAQMVGFSRARVSGVIASLKRNRVLSSTPDHRFLIHRIGSLQQRGLVPTSRP